MTQPIQEPTNPRRLTSFGYGQDQLFRRPSPAPPGTGEIWAYMASFDTQEIANNTWTNPPTWTDFYLSDGAVGILSAAADFRILLEASSSVADDDGGVWLQTVISSWSESTPGAGTYVGLGNLIQAGGWISQFDVHDFQPANILIPQAFNQAHEVTVQRVRQPSTTDSYFSAEVWQNTGGNFTLGAVELVVTKIADWDGANSSFS